MLVSIYQPIYNNDVSLSNEYMYGYTLWHINNVNILLLLSFGAGVGD